MMSVGHFFPFSILKDVYLKLMLLMSPRGWNKLYKSFRIQDLKDLLDPELSIITKLEDSNLWPIAYDLLLHVMVLYHVMHFPNLYLVFLSISQCNSWLMDILEISHDMT